MWLLHFPACSCSFLSYRLLHSLIHHCKRMAKGTVRPLNGISHLVNSVGPLWNDIGVSLYSYVYNIYNTYIHIDIDIAYLRQTNDKGTKKMLGCICPEKWGGPGCTSLDCYHIDIPIADCNTSRQPRVHLVARTPGGLEMWYAVIYNPVPCKFPNIRWCQHQSCGQFKSICSSVPGLHDSQVSKNWIQTTLSALQNFTNLDNPDWHKRKLKNM